MGRQPLENRETAFFDTPPQLVQTPHAQGERTAASAFQTPHQAEVATMGARSPDADPATLSLPRFILDPDLGTLTNGSLVAYFTPLESEIIRALQPGEIVSTAQLRDTLKNPHLEVGKHIFKIRERFASLNRRGTVIQTYRARHDKSGYRLLEQITIADKPLNTPAVEAVQQDESEISFEASPAQSQDTQQPSTTHPWRTYGSNAPQSSPGEQHPSIPHASTEAPRADAAEDSVPVVNDGKFHIVGVLPSQARLKSSPDVALNPINKIIPPPLSEQALKRLTIGERIVKKVADAIKRGGDPADFDPCSLSLLGDTTPHSGEAENLLLGSIHDENLKAQYGIPSESQEDLITIRTRDGQNFVRTLTKRLRQLPRV